MGEVYRATDTTLKRAVAIKVVSASFALDPERVARLQREAQVLASLNHPNIAAIYGLEQSAGVTALVMELVDGPTLADRIARGAMPLPDVKAVGTQIADALEAAHQQGVIHRDLKPANIKVRPDGTVKVLDFGLARAMAPHEAPSSSASQLPTITTPAMTQLGVAMGTPAYMSPEQARGERIDRRADVWAFGAVLFEMLTGRRPFEGSTISDVLASVLAREPDWTLLPPTVSPALRVFVQRCLHKDPRHRIRDAGDVRLALDGVFDAPASAAPIVAGWSKWATALPWAVAAVALLAAMSLGAAYMFKGDAAPAVVRTMIPPPDNATFDFDLTAAPAVLAPNGRAVAFGARSADGVTQLWVRPLDSSEARPLPDTIGASFPFWSPDSRSLGFYNPSRGRLERIDLAGGSPVAIARAGFVRGAHWGPNDTIVFDGDGRIATVAAAGGALTPLSTPGVAPGEDPRSPWLLPDGRHVLYTARRSGQIRVVALDGTGDALVTEATSSGMVVNDRLLFMREGTLLSQPFDVSRSSVIGEPTPLASGVQMVVGEPRGVFSASVTGALLYQDGGTEPAISLAWFDPDGKGRRVIGEMGNARGVFLSPDDRSAIVRITDADQRSDLWRIDTGDGHRTRLTFETETDGIGGFTAWSPDGRYIANAARRRGKIVVTRRPAAGGAEDVLMEVPSDALSVDLPRVSDWSRDGTLVYSGNDAASGVRLAGSDPSRPALRPSAPVVASGQNGRLSPNGKWISYQASLGNTPVAGVYVATFPSGGQRLEVSKNATLGVWAPSGDALYYASDNMLYRVDISESARELRLGTPRAVMPVIQGRGFSFDIAQDGRILALVTSDRRASRPLTLVQNWTAALGAK